MSLDELMMLSGRGHLQLDFISSLQLNQSNSSLLQQQLCLRCQLLHFSLVFVLSPMSQKWVVEQSVAPSSGCCGVLCCLCSKGFCSEFWCFLSLWASEHSSTQQSLSLQQRRSPDLLVSVFCWCELRNLKESDELIVPLRCRAGTLVWISGIVGTTGYCR